MEKKNRLIFFGFRSLEGKDGSFVADCSPLCLKLMVYLIASNWEIDYSSIVVNEDIRPKKSPQNGMLPFIQMYEGWDSYIADSEVIIETLGNPLDASLDQSQIAIRHLLRNLIENSCNWTVGFDWRWGNLEMCKNITASLYLDGLGIRSYFQKRAIKAARKQQIQRLEAYGRAGYSLEERMELGRKDLQTIENEMVNYDGGYFFGGETATSIDCILYGMSANAIFTAINYPVPFDAPAYKLFAGDYPNILQHYKFMEAAFDGDLRTIVDPESESASLELHRYQSRKKSGGMLCCTTNRQDIIENGSSVHGSQTEVHSDDEEKISQRSYETEGESTEEEAKEQHESEEHDLEQSKPKIHRPWYKRSGSKSDEQEIEEFVEMKSSQRSRNTKNESMEVEVSEYDLDEHDLEKSKRQSEHERDIEQGTHRPWYRKWRTQKKSKNEDEESEEVQSKEKYEELDSGSRSESESDFEDEPRRRPWYKRLSCRKRVYSDDEESEISSKEHRDEYDSDSDSYFEEDNHRRSKTTTNQLEKNTKHEYEEIHDQMEHEDDESFRDEEDIQESLHNGLNSSHHSQYSKPSSTKNQQIEESYKEVEKNWLSYDEQEKDMTDQSQQSNVSSRNYQKVGETHFEELKTPQSRQSSLSSKTSKHSNSSLGQIQKTDESQSVDKKTYQSSQISLSSRKSKRGSSSSRKSEHSGSNSRNEIKSPESNEEEEKSHKSQHSYLSSTKNEKVREIVYEEKSHQSNQSSLSSSKSKSTSSSSKQKHKSDESSNEETTHQSRQSNSRSRKSKHSSLSSRKSHKSDGNNKNVERTDQSRHSSFSSRKSKHSSRSSEKSRKSDESNYEKEKISRSNHSSLTSRKTKRSDAKTETITPSKDETKGSGSTAVETKDESENRSRGKPKFEPPKADGNKIVFMSNTYV